MKKRAISFILAVILVIGVCPMGFTAYKEMSFSENIVTYIKKGEGFISKPYADGTGWYIGYGCACNPADYPNGITEAGADLLLRDRMQSFANTINKFLKKYDVGVTQGQFDAMCGMSYALGPAWLNAANRLPSYLINGVENYTDQQIATSFAAWCHVGSAVNTVALKRRIMEAKMFLDDDYSFTADGWNWLILDANGGENSYSNVAVFRSGQAYGSLPEATKSGKYFAGWQTSEGSILRASDIVGKNYNVKALWSDTPIAAEPANTPEPEESPEPEVSPQPEESSEPEEPSEPESGQTPAESPQPSESPEPTSVPEPQESPEPGEAENSTVFPDVFENEWFAPYVSELVAAGVVNGYEDGTFRPRNNVTWGEALKLILLASGYPEQERIQPATAEKKEGEREYPNHWANGYLAFAEKKKFLPEESVQDLNQPITRNEIADLCALALELSGLPEENPFSDTNRKSVLALYAEGIMEGSIENGMRLFKGTDNINRAEICAVLLRVMDYVKRTLILFAGYRIPIDYSLKFNNYDKSAFSLQNGRTYYDDGEIKVRYGIDVSEHQGIIDWKKVAKDGFDFAIIRCGYRGYGKGALNEDPYYQDNINGALAAGLDVGVYFFSQATNVDEALEEAEYTLSLIRDYPITFPVVFDWEQISTTGSRTQRPDWGTVTECIIAFCDEMAKHGYTPMTYYNPSMAYLRLDLSRLQKYDTWLANYVAVSDYLYDYQMWQYGSSGKVAGIEGRADLNISFVDFTA